MVRNLIVATGALVLAAAALTACTRSLADHDNLYSRGTDQFVWCSINIDGTRYGLEEIADALERAKVDGTTLHFYAHVPGETIEPSKIEHVLRAVHNLGLQIVTYDELSAHEVPGSLALSFDDNRIDSWMSIRDLLASYQVHVTFFVSGFLEFTDAGRAQLRQLADDGHDIEYHSTHHLDAAQFIADHGMADYIASEITPALDAMRAAGYGPQVFAYPGGGRSPESDAALRPYFEHLRGIASHCP